MISIITVNFNETASTCALLDSIRRQEYPDVEVIVVDNASRENPAALFQTEYPEVIFIRSEQNLGFAGGNNLALEKAHGEYLFFVNNDAELEFGCLEFLERLFEKQPNMGMVSPMICYFPASARATHRIQYAGMTAVSPFTGRNKTIGALESDWGQFAEPRKTAYAHGAAMMISRAVLAEVGPMWTGFFLYYEELDWCERIRQAGFDIWIEPRAKVLHKESLTLGKMGTAKTFYLTRSRILFMRRHFSGWRWGVFLTFFGLISLPKSTFSYIMKGDFDNLRAFWRGVLSHFSPRSQAPFSV